MRVGIVGLTASGKRTLFSLLTGISNNLDLHQQTLIGVVDVPDKRVDFLADHFKSKKRIYSRIEFSLLPSISKDSHNKNILETKDIDIFAFVVRQFKNPDVFHPLENIDVVRDYLHISEEFILTDLVLIETRLERIEKQIKIQKNEQILKEKEVLLLLKETLENGRFLNSLNLDKDKLKAISGLKFLTLRPIFIIVNCDEESLFNSYDFPGGVKSINISVKIEQEIQQLEEKEREEFLNSMGLKESPLHRLINFSYQYADLISFLTAGEKESRAWTIKKGTTALEAAGVIHTDIQKGFIRAEVISFDDFIKAGSEGAAKRLGLYRLEGKEYIVKDGDIIEFRFNI